MQIEYGLLCFWNKLKNGFNAALGLADIFTTLDVSNCQRVCQFGSVLWVGLLLEI